MLDSNIYIFLLSKRKLNYFEKLDKLQNKTNLVNMFLSRCYENIKNYFIFQILQYVFLFKANIFIKQYYCLVDIKLLKLKVQLANF